MVVKTFSINIHDTQFDSISKLVGNVYSSRSDVIRCAVRDYLKEQIPKYNKEVNNSK